MSKIIIHNNSKQSDLAAASLVTCVIGGGFVSGEKQYCLCTTNSAYRVTIYSKPTRGTTHTFEVRDL